ncbi:MAG: IclR family transcriptional regulator C-terminal domain-containing protein [Enterocloster clostridioformis]
MYAQRIQENQLPAFYLLWISFLRSQDYAVDDEEIALGVRCIATPIYDYRGVVNYILGISGTTNNIKPFSMDRYLSALLSASSQILVLRWVINTADRARRFNRPILMEIAAGKTPELSLWGFRFVYPVNT